MQARIYQRPKNAMQSGKALTDEWVLDFVPAEAKKPDPLMGWAGSGDTQPQVAAALPEQGRSAGLCRASTASRRRSTSRRRARLKLQAYADNFR